MSESVVIAKKVKVFSSTAGGAVDITTTATNYGAFQQDLQREGINVEKMNVVMRGEDKSRTALIYPDTPLPEGDFVVLISPAMQKGAAFDVKSADFTSLRRFAKEIGITGLGSNPSKAELIKAIEKSYKGKEGATIKEKKAIKKDVVEKLTEKVAETKAPVEVRTATLTERFKALLEGKFQDKEEVKALVKDSRKAIDDAHEVINESQQVHAGLMIISDILEVEAEEVLENEEVPAPKQEKSWVDTLSKEDVFADLTK